MYVIATAGHVDHGKSTLVRALTGMEPDRWAEERRRGLTIDLGFAWMTLPGGEQLAFVDVPGHERFVPNMLAGLGPVPAVLFVVAADGGWMPQSAEHLAAVDALGVRHGLLVVTRCDLADPARRPARRSPRSRGPASARCEAVAVSAVTGAGLPDLRAALARLVAGAARPRPGRPGPALGRPVVHHPGRGTVVTGTLPAGTVTAGQELLLTAVAAAGPGARPRGARRARRAGHRRRPGGAQPARRPGRPPGPRHGAHRAGRWTLTGRSTSASRPRRSRATFPPELRCTSARPGPRPGSASSARLGSPPIARLPLRDPLPLHVGDRVMLRDPGAGAGDLRRDRARPAPPPLARRGAAAAAVRELAAWPDPPSAADLLRRHRLLRAAAWPRWASPAARRRSRGTGSPTPALGLAARRLPEVVAAFCARDPLDPAVVGRLEQGRLLLHASSAS